MERQKIILVVAVLAGCGGCIGDARVHLATADSIDLIRGAMAESLAEYHADLTSLDAQRRDAVVEAFVVRMRADASEAQAADADAEAFRQAVTRIDTDREVAWRRYAASLDTLGVLGEIASDLRRLAAESMSLDDEASGYFTDLTQKQKDRKLQAAVSKVNGGLASDDSSPRGRRAATGIAALRTLGVLPVDVSRSTSPTYRERN
jgi:hypothetical protein